MFSHSSKQKIIAPEIKGKREIFYFKILEENINAGILEYLAECLKDMNSFLP